MGGIYPGVKLGLCAAGAQPAVSARVLQLAPAARAALDAHLCVAFTGRTRLARGLLDGVLRAWQRRDGSVLALFDGLVGGAHAMARALEAADMAAAGALLSDYWARKRALAPGAEPAAVSAMLAGIAPHAHGAALAGAGGGGFLLAISREPHPAHGALGAVLRAHGAEVYAGARVVHGHGLQLSHEQAAEEHYPAERDALDGGVDVASVSQLESYY